ncbi:EAL domain-containing response regulator [soil metagenome]
MKAGMPNTDSVTPARPGILLVDDDPFMLGVLSQTLRGMGYPTLRTASGAQIALDLLKREAGVVDLIICDLNMPGMDGIEFLQTLSATSFSGSIILLSGEGLRVMHTVQKLLGSSRLVILGAIEKPANQAGLRVLLDHWNPAGAAPRRPPALSFECDEIRAAVDAAQWVLHYQPKVDLKTGFVTGMEALVRWDHPLHGLVYPDNFISTVEECGAIDTLTDWVMNEAFTQVARWRRTGLSLQMAVNVSMDNLRTPGFAAHVTALARRAAVSPGELTLEITESRLMSPTPVPLEILVRLRLGRFGLSIDDFGTGHSSLAQLRDVPFTELKVDRGFVQGARHNQIIRPILDGSIGIAKRMGMHSVAEGVETEDDWMLLQEIGCDLAQGYFIGRPMPLEKVESWLADWKIRRPALVEA